MGSSKSASSSSSSSSSINLLMSRDSAAMWVLQEGLGMVRRLLAHGYLIHDSLVHDFLENPALQILDAHFLHIHDGNMSDETTRSRPTGRP
jgi:hypothetical protein